jgi:spore germination cell wall hydrolase CwlJ-like protein
MFVSIRSAILVMASLASASVAPAQTIQGQLTPASYSPKAVSSEPLIASNAIPTLAQPAVLDSSSAATNPSANGQDDQQNANEIKSVPLERALGEESLGTMVTRLRSSEAATHERECLATAIYFESKSEPLAGQLAVGEVLANRVRSGRFASSYCGVVMQPGQFSFIRNHALPSVPRHSLQWKNAVAIATIVDAGLKSSDAPRALFFHARSVSPGWHATRVATIGNHVFFR